MKEIMIWCTWRWIFSSHVDQACGCKFIQKHSSLSCDDEWCHDKLHQLVGIQMRLRLWDEYDIDSNMVQS